MTPAPHPTRIAGLMPVKWEPGKSNAWGSVEQLQSLCDVVILADIGPVAGGFHFPGVEVVRIASHAEWDDFGNRITLLARAAAHRCDWVIWLDDDETLPQVTRAIVDAQIVAAKAQGYIAVAYCKREMWTPTHYRNDNAWQKMKIIVQQNPLLQPQLRWRPTYGRRLHAFPIQEGAVMEAPTMMLHFGMCQPAWRQERVAKYRLLDPNNEFQPDYNYLLDETGLVLVPAPL